MISLYLNICISSSADGDTLVFIDFRADRMRQIVEAFGLQRHFETDVVAKNLVSKNIRFKFNIRYLLKEPRPVA